MWVSDLCGSLWENIVALALEQSLPYNATRSITIVVTNGPIYLWQKSDGLQAGVIFESVQLRNRLS